MKRKLLLGVLAGLSATACGSAEEANKAWSSFSKCLIGKPLTGNESVYARLRPLELTLKKPGAGKDAWPNKCAKHGDKLYESIDKSGDTTLLKMELGKIGCGKKEGCRFPDDGPMLANADKIWAGAKKAGLKTVDVDVSPPPAVKLDVGTAADLKGIGDAQLRVETERRTAAGGLWAILRAGTGPRVFCRFDDGMSKHSCKPVAPDLKRQLHFLVDDDKPMVGMLTEAGRKGFDIEKGGEPQSIVGEAGAETRNGLAVVQYKTGKFRIENVKDGNSRSKNELKIEATINPALAGPAAVWPGGDGLNIVPLSESGKPGEQISVKGEFGKAPTVCPGKDEASVVNMPKGKSGGTVWVAMLNGGKWTSASAKLPANSTATLTCDGGTARIAWGGGGTKLAAGVITCTAGKCSEKMSTWPGMAAQAWLLTAAFGDNLAVVYRNAYGAVARRFGPADGLAKAEDKLLYDDPEHAGPKFENARAYAGKSGALLLFSGEKKLHALHVSPKGEVKSVE